MIFPFQNPPVFFLWDPLDFVAPGATTFIQRSGPLWNLVLEDAQGILARLGERYEYI